MAVDDGIQPKLVEDQTTLVLVGSWNPAILSPTWIGRNILGLDQGQTFQVAMLLPVQGQGGTPRLSFEGISITPAQNQLIFHLDPNDAAMVTKSLLVARRILETLPHTPMMAMGVNFTYEVDPLKGDSPKAMGWANHTSDLLIDDPDAEVLNRLWQVGIATMGHMMNVTYRTDAQGATIAINHHYELEGSVKKAVSHLADETIFNQLFDITQKFVRELSVENAN
jgi:hypothetical protein